MAAAIARVRSRSHRRTGDGGGARRALPHAGDRISACARTSVSVRPAAFDDALAAGGFLLRAGLCGGPHHGGRRQRRRQSDHRADQSIARHAERAQPAGAWLASPWTDLTMSGETLRQQGRGRSADSQRLSRRAGDSLRAAAAATGSPAISPLFSDLRGFPPTLIRVGSARNAAG